MKSFAIINEQTLLVGAVRGLYQVDISNLKAMFDTPDIALKNKTLISELNIWKIIPEANSITLGTDKGLFEYNPETGELAKNMRLKESGYTLADTIIFGYQPHIPLVRLSQYTNNVGVS